jgi:hypothetical protein
MTALIEPGVDALRRFAARFEADLLTLAEAGR